MVMKKRKKNCGHVKGNEHDTETSKCSKLSLGNVTKNFPSKLQNKAALVFTKAVQHILVI